jgi:hypothetical protein
MYAAILAFVVIGLLTATDAQAQHLFRKGAGRQGISSATVSGSSSTPAARSYSYSYYSRSSLPARTYVGYGDNDFPFHGQPYGHPYDAFTWSAMSGSYANDMARYYAPPVK